MVTLCRSCYMDTEGQHTDTCGVCSKTVHADCRIKEDDKIYCDTCYTQKSVTRETVEFTIPDVIRRTYIETYRSCPHKFFHEVLNGKHQGPTCYTQIGSDLHDLFERGLNDRSYTIDQMKHDYTQTWHNVYPDMDLFKDEEQKEAMWKRSMDSIDTYYHVLPDIPIPMVTEQTIHYSIGDDIPNVEFTMDAVIEGPDGLELLDWKTGQVMVGKKLSSDLQAPLYIYGVQKHFGRPVKKFTFYYLKDNKTRVFEHVEGVRYKCSVGKRDYYINLDECVKEIQRIFAQINKGNFNIPQDTKSMYFTCKMCHLPAMGLCEGAELQSWHNK